MCVLFAFDPNGSERYQRVLDFLEKDEYKFYNYNHRKGCYGLEYYHFFEFNCVVNDGDILFHCSGKNYICVSDSKGNIKSRLSINCLVMEDGVKMECIRLQCVTNQNDIVMRSSKRVFIYTKEGKFKDSVKYVAKDNEAIFGKHPEREFVEQIAFNYATSKIDIPVSNSQLGGTNNQCTILSYSEYKISERLYLPFRSISYLWQGTLCSHPAGPAALINQRTFYADESKIIFM